MRLKGLIAATFTPFDAQGKINLAAIPVMVDRLVANKIAGIYVCGSTGEGHSLTVPERKALAGSFHSANAGRMKTIINVGHNALEDACDLAKHAAAIGADAISAAPPTYYKIGSEAQLVKVLAKITSAAPNIPFYYYHIPAITRTELDMGEFLRMSIDALPSLHGIKFTSPNIHEYQRCLEQSEGKHQILFGLDEMMLSALGVGASCMIGSTYNFMPGLYHGVMENFNNGNYDAARAFQYKAVQVINAFLKFSSIPAQKSIMRMIGMDCGPVRLPLQDLTADEQLRLEADLAKFDLQKWVAGAKAVKVPS